MRVDRKDNNEETAAAVLLPDRRKRKKIKNKKISPNSKVTLNVSSET